MCDARFGRNDTEILETEVLGRQNICTGLFFVCFLFGKQTPWWKLFEKTSKRSSRKLKRPSKAAPLLLSTWSYLGWASPGENRDSRKRKVEEDPALSPVLWEYVNAGINYNSAKTVPQTFSIIQLGLSTFTEVAGGGCSDNNNTKYICEAFNFYLFKDYHGGAKKEISFSLSAVDFLRTYNFDFGKVMSHGVSYLAEDEEKEQKVYWEKKVGGGIKKEKDRFGTIR